MNDFMSGRSTATWFSWGGLMAAMLALSVPGIAQQLQQAPVNQKFIQAKSATPAEVNFGYRPGPVSLSRVAHPLKLAWGPLRVLPASYDLRTDSKMTAVRDQGNYGTCWAHA